MNVRLKISKIWRWGGFGVMQGLLLQPCARLVNFRCSDPITSQFSLYLHQLPSGRNSPNFNHLPELSNLSYSIMSVAGNSAQIKHRRVFHSKAKLSLNILCRSCCKDNGSWWTKLVDSRTFRTSSGLKTDARRDLRL